tara:strand:- start:191 stop:583 length:393 start_codon:yes stop_codon:yes gene_type:complete
MYLIALALSGQGSWSKVYRLQSDEGYTNVIIITNNYGKERFNTSDKTKVFAIDNFKSVQSLKDDIKEILKPEIKELEVSVNIDSGTGREHTAFLCALIELGIGMKFVTVESDQIITVEHTNDYITNPSNE